MDKQRNANLAANACISRASISTARARSPLYPNLEECHLTSADNTAVVTQPAPSNIMTNHAMLPRPFSGEPGDDIREWVETFEELAEANNWTTDEEKLRRIAVFITGTAKQAVKSFCNGRTLRGYDVYVQLLLSLFAPRCPGRVDFQAMSSRKQRIAEPATNYALEKLQLIKRCQPSASEADRIELVITGLNSVYLPDIYSRKFEDSKELLNYLKLKDEAKQVAASTSLYHEYSSS